MQPLHPDRHVGKPAADVAASTRKFQGGSRVCFARCDVVTRDRLLCRITALNEAKSVLDDPEHRELYERWLDHFNGDHDKAKDKAQDAYDEIITKREKVRGYAVVV